MGKVVSIQSIIVATAATGWQGNEGKYCATCFGAPLYWARWSGVLVMLQAYVWPFTLSVPN